MKHPRFNISLYLLVPIIFGGIALLSVITTHQILKYTRLIPDPELYLKCLFVRAPHHVAFAEAHEEFHLQDEVHPCRVETGEGQKAGQGR